MKINKVQIIRNTIAVFCTLYLFSVFTHMVKTSTQLLNKELFLNHLRVSYVEFFFLLVSTLLITFILYIYSRNKNLIDKNVYQYRWYLALLAIIILVLLKVHGSSVGMWGNYFTFDGSTTEPLIGVNRAIRSDEWALFTPMAFSQDMNSYQYFSPFWRGTPSDMFLIYGQPIFDIVQLFRPFQIGYLFLPSEYGLSFYWVSRFIVLFLVSYDFFRLFTKQKHRLSLLAAVLITLSPAVQWWFSINSLVELLISGFFGILMIHYFLKTKIVYKKILYSIGICIAAGTYLFSVYPAWQIPMAYIFALLLLILIYEYKEEYTWKKINYVYFTVIFLTFLFISFRIYMFSKETYAIVQNTVYPGERFELGGGGIQHLFNGYESLVSGLLYEDITSRISPFSNVVERAAFLDFFPIPLVLSSVYIIFQSKRSDKGLLLLTGLAYLFLGWISFSWLPIFAQITLFKNVTVGRMIVPFGLLNIIILIRFLQLLQVEKLTKKKRNGLLTVFIVSVMYVIIELKYKSLYFSADTFGAKLSFYMVVIVFILFTLLAVIYMCRVEGRKTIRTIALYFIFMMSVASSFFVNPISTNNKLETLRQSELSQTIQKMSESDEKWITVSDVFIQNNYLPTLGVHALNSTNVYPNLELWEKIFPNDKDEYNRYAHIMINIVAGESKITAGTDTFQAEINIDDLKKIDVKYILSTKKIENLNTTDTQLKEIKNINGVYIYECVYATVA